MTLDEGAFQQGFLKWSHASVFDVPLRVVAQGATKDIAILPRLCRVGLYGNLQKGPATP